MRRVMIHKLPAVGERAMLDAEEAKHVRGVLRLGDGDEIEVLDGSGSAVVARLQLDGRNTQIEAVRQIDGERTASDAVLPIVVAMAIPKGDAMAWVIEKCVELGVGTLRPFFSEHSVVQSGKKGPDAFLERWRKIGHEALKQSGRLRRLEIPSVATSLEQVVRDLAASSPDAELFFCDEQLVNADKQQHLATLLRRKPPQAKGAVVLIGPEGGWSQRERGLLQNSRWQPTALGAHVLRSETAAVFAASLLVGAYR